MKWADEVRSICGSNIPVMLVGCKKDLRDATGQPLDERNWVTRERVGTAYLLNQIEVLKTS